MTFELLNNRRRVMFLAAP